MDQLDNLIRRCESAVSFNLLGGRDSADFVKKIRERASILQLSDADQVIAFVSYYANTQPKYFGYINMVCVDPQHQGKGLAKLLIVATCDAVKMAGFQQVRLEVSVHNEIAIRLYAKLGFFELERKGQNLYMVKKLENLAIRTAQNA